MAILVDKQIKTHCRSNDAVMMIRPFHESLLGSCSYHLCLGDTYRKEKVAPFTPIDPGAKEWRQAQAADGKITLWPKQLIIASTIECIDLRGRICGRVASRDLLGRSAISVQALSNHLSPGFCGPVELLIYNMGWTPIILRVGMPIAKIVFDQTEFLPSSNILVTR